MEINRKRVARRLVSGLVAGALALGGLAISGGSVSAKTPSSPTTNRIAGDDRYETAVELARKVNSISDGLVIASGESPWDALTAAALTSANRPMLLVSSNSVSESVLDFLSDYKSQLAGGSDTIYVIGGTSVISDEVADTVLAASKTAGDLLPPKIKRVAGDDRYATSKAVAALTATAAGKAILVNGTSWADAVAAGVMSAQNGWPIILTPGAYSGDAKAAIDAYMALPGSVSQFLIVGGPAVMPTSIDEALVGELVAPADIVRIGGADRYQTSMLVNTWLYTNDAQFDGRNIALVSGENYPDALAAAGWAAVSGTGTRVHVLLSPAAGGNIWATTLSSTLTSLVTNGLSANGNSELWMIGGKSAISDAAKAGWISAAANDVTTTSVCPAEGGTSLTIVWSGDLTVAERLNLADYTKIGPMIKKNGTALGAAGFSAVAALVPYKISASTYLLTLAAPAAEDDVFKLATDIEGANSINIGRTAVGSSCTVVDDSTKPSATIRAVAGTSGDGSAAADQYYVVTASEPIQVAELVKKANWTINTKTPANDMSCVAVGASGAVFNCNFSAAEAGVGTTAALQVVTLAAAGLKDLANNVAAAPASTAVVADSTAPTFTGAAVCAHKTASTRLRGSLKVTDNGLRGASGNAYVLSVVNSRGMLIPTVAVDDTAKTITVTADVNYHTVGDVINAAKNAGPGDLLLGSWKFEDDSLGNGLVATVTPVVPVDGKSSCVLTLTGSEPFVTETGAVTVNGLSAVVSGYTNLAEVAWAGSDDAKHLTNTISFDTTMTGAGVLSFTVTKGPKDGKGNEFLGGVSFTIS